MRAARPGPRPRSLPASLLAVLAGLTTAALVAVLGVLPAAADAVAHAPTQTAGDVAWSVATVDNDHGEGRPNYSYALEPGAVVVDGLAVTNTGTAALTLGVAAADGFTTADGILDLRPLSEPAVDLGAWVVPSETELVVEPGERVEVPFTLTVPADAAPGDHTGGIVTVRTGADGGTVQLEQRLGSRIHVRVAGEQAVATTLSAVVVDQPVPLVPLATATTTVHYVVRNEGNVRTVTTERILLAGPGGLGEVEHVVTGPEVLPGSEVVRTVEIPGTRPLGWADVTVEVTPQAVDGELAPATSAQARTWAVPWPTLVVLALVVALAVATGARRARGQSNPGRWRGIGSRRDRRDGQPNAGAGQ